MIFEDYFRVSRIKTTKCVVVLAFLILACSTSGWEKYGIIPTIFFVVGTIMVGIATIGRLWCSIYISGYKNSQLITVGPYSVSRNPLYLFTFVGIIGLGLNTETLIVPTSASLAFMMYYPSVITQEEIRLREKHSEAFEAYCRAVPRLIPSFSRIQGPETYVVRPKVFRRRLFDSLWFVWGIGIIEVIEGLHESGILTSFFTLY